MPICLADLLVGMSPEEPAVQSRMRTASPMSTGEPGSQDQSAGASTARNNFASREDRDLGEPAFWHASFAKTKKKKWWGVTVCVVKDPTGRHDETRPYPPSPAAVQRTLNPQSPHNLLPPHDRLTTTMPSTNTDIRNLRPAPISTTPSNHAVHNLCRVVQCLPRPIELGLPCPSICAYTAFHGLPRPLSRKT